LSREWAPVLAELERGRTEYDTNPSFVTCGASTSDALRMERNIATSESSPAQVKSLGLGLRAPSGVRLARREEHEGGGERRTGATCFASRGRRGAPWGRMERNIATSLSSSPAQVSFLAFEIPTYLARWCKSGAIAFALALAPAPALASPRLLIAHAAHLGISQSTFAMRRSSRNESRLRARGETADGV
jgi:hypothetical protein